MSVAVPSAVASAMLFGFSQRPYPVEPLELAGPELKCGRPPTFTVGYKAEESAVVPQQGGFRMQGVSWLEADLCTPGTLVVTADGEPAAGEAPVLEVELNSRSLVREAFSQRRTTYVEIPHPGRLILGYFNDYYLSEARAARLERISIQGADCRTMQVDVPPETGGSWSPTSAAATLVSNVPMTLRPCGPGDIRMSVFGRAGGGAFPMLQFEQEGRTLLKVQTDQAKQYLRLRVTSAPLTITLINPYAKLVGDRNLNIRKLEFRPARPTVP